MSGDRTQQSRSAAIESSTRKWIRRFRTSIWTALTIVVVLAAVLVGVARLLLPYSDRYKPELEGWLTQVLAEPVTVEEFDGDWVAFGPRLNLSGLQLSTSDARVARAELDIKLLNFFWPGRSPYRFSLDGIELSLARQADGRWQFRPDDSSLTAGKNRTDPAHGLERLASVGELLISDSVLNLNPGGGVEPQRIQIPQARLQATGDDIAVNMEMTLDAEDAGELELTALFTRQDGRTRLQQAYLELGEWTLEEWRPLNWLPVAPPRDLQLGGRVSAQLWLDMATEGGWQVTGRMDGEQLNASVADTGSGTGPLQVNRLAGDFELQQDQAGWQLRLGQAQLDQAGDPGPLDLSGWAIRQSAEQTQIHTGALDLARLNPLWGFMQQLIGDVPAWPTHTAGRSGPLQLAWSSEGDLLAARGQVQDLSLELQPGPKSVSGLDLSMDYTAPGGEIRLQGQQVMLGLDQIFDAPVLLGQLDCPLLVRVDGIVEAGECSVQGPAGRVSMAGLLQFNDGRPYVDMSATLSALNAAELKPFVPTGVLSEKVSRWLLQAVPEGQGENGRLLLSGDLDRWPFGEGNGVIFLRLPVSGARFRYADGWSPMTDVAGLLTIQNQSLEVTDARAGIAGLSIDSASARVTDLRNAVVELDLSGHGRVPRIAAFLQDAPVLDTLDEWLPRLELEGQAAVDMSLTLPLGQQPLQPELNGEVRLDDATATDTESGYQADQISGQLTFTQNSLNSEGLDFGLPAESQAGPASGLARISLQTRPDLDLNVSVESTAGVDALLPPVLENQVPDRVHGLLGLIQGRTGWLLDWRLMRPGDQDASALQSTLRLNSDLDGLDIQFPQPLSKPGAQSWPLEATLSGVPGGDQQLHLNLNDQLRLAGRFAGDDSQASSLGFGWRADVPDEMPAGTWSGVINAQQLDAREWWRLIAPLLGETSGSGTALQLHHLNLSAAELGWGDTVLSHQAVHWSPEPAVVAGGDPGWSIRLQGDVSGQVRVPAGIAGETRGDVHIELDRLHWPRGEPSDSPVEASSDLNPGNLPALHLVARDVRYGDLVLDQLQFDGVPIDQGMRFDRITAASEQLDIRASGRWLKQGDAATSQLDFYLTTENLGSVLTDLGMAGQLEIGQAIVDLSGSWAGAPSRFSLAGLSGELALDIGQGRLVTAEPGAGRLLGLVSLQNLPRRLTLDFTDVFQEGFQFDRAAGVFSLDAGIADTENFTIESPAATVLVSGETNLTEQTWNQEITVLPGVANTLPVIGAIAGGPAGAAAGLALQGLLQGRMGEALSTRYAITGPWDSPRVETLSSPQSGGGASGRSARPRR